MCPGIQLIENKIFCGLSAGAVSQSLFVSFLFDLWLSPIPTLAELLLTYFLTFPLIITNTNFSFSPTFHLVLLGMNHPRVWSSGLSSSLWFFFYFIRSLWHFLSLSEFLIFSCSHNPKLLWLQASSLISLFTFPAALKCWITSLVQSLHLFMLWLYITSTAPSLSRSSSTLCGLCVMGPGWVSEHPSYLILWKWPKLFSTGTT